MRRQTYGYLPSSRASLPSERYWFILVGEGGTVVWTTCPRSLSDSGTAGRPGVEHATSNALTSTPPRHTGYAGQLFTRRSFPTFASVDRSLAYLLTYFVDLHTDECVRVVGVNDVVTGARRVTRQSAHDDRPASFYRTETHRDEITTPRTRRHLNPVERTCYVLATDLCTSAWDTATPPTEMPFGSVHFTFTYRQFTPPATRRSRL